MGQRQKADLSVFGRIKFITRRNINTLYVAAILFSRSSLHRESLPNTIVVVLCMQTKHCIAIVCILTCLFSIISCTYRLENEDLIVYCDSELFQLLDSVRDHIGASLR